MQFKLRKRIGVAGMEKELDFQISLKQTTACSNNRNVKKSVNYSNWMKAKVNKTANGRPWMKEMYINRVLLNSRFDSWPRQLDEVIKCY